MSREKVFSSSQEIQRMVFDFIDEQYFLLCPVYHFGAMGSQFTIQGQRANGSRTAVAVIMVDDDGTIWVNPKFEWEQVFKPDGKTWIEVEAAKAVVAYIEKELA